MAEPMWEYSGPLFIRSILRMAQQQRQSVGEQALTNRSRENGDKFLVIA
jgi:hypothetical protein